MNTRLTTGLLSCLIMPLFVGCANSPSLIRGQSPVPPAPAELGDVSEVSTTADASKENAPFPYNTFPAQMMKKNVHHRAGMYSHTMAKHPEFCPDCYRNGDVYWDGEKWCPRENGRRCHHPPRHMYQHMYRIPRNMSYPQNPTPAAVTVYPYYTHKGPDDFFYTGE